MPNHVKNIVKFNCDNEKLLEILLKIQYDNNGENQEYGLGTIDFNKIIPMPESLKIEKGSRTDDAIELYMTAVNPKASYFGSDKQTENEFIQLEYKIRAYSEDKHRNYRTKLSLYEINNILQYDDIGEMLSIGKTAVDNIQKYGTPTWYEFCINNWGTKWNSYDCLNNIENVGNGQIEFSTAWSSPDQVIEKLSEIFTDVEIKHLWADEDIGRNCGERTYKNGQCIHYHLPEKGSKEAQIFACQLWRYEDEGQDIVTINL